MSDHRYLHLVRADCPVPPGTPVIAYCRDSGGEEQDRSTQQQIEVIREYCEHHKLILQKIYVDEARSAARAEKRENLLQMLEDLQKRFPIIDDLTRREKRAETHPFALILWKSNRLSRDDDRATHIKADLRLRAISIIDLSVKGGDTGSRGVNKVVEVVTQMQDEQLLAEISRNAKRGLAELVSLRDTDPEFRHYNPDWPTHDGRYLSLLPGKPPTGFKGVSIQVGVRERKRRTGTTMTQRHVVQRIEPDHEDQRWERCLLAWQMRRDGFPIKTIMEQTHLFNTVGGYTTFFSNRIYCGDLDYGGKRYVDFVPALISRQWFEDEQRNVEARSAKYNHRQVEPDLEPRRMASRHLLSGLLFCGNIAEQEHPMVADTVSERPGRSRWDFYVCDVRQRTRQRDCQSARLSARSVQNAVIETLLMKVLTFENLRPKANDIYRSLQAHNEPLVERLAEARARLNDVQVAIRKLLDVMENTGFSMNLKTRLEERETEERQLTTEIATLEASLLSADDMPLVSDEMLNTFLSVTRTNLVSDNVEVARLALKKVVKKVVMQQKAGTLYYTFPLEAFTELPRIHSVPPRGSFSFPTLFDFFFHIVDLKPKSILPNGESASARNEKICAKYREGFTLKQLAKLFGISYQRVHQIINAC